MLAKQHQGRETRGMRWNVIMCIACVGVIGQTQTLAAERLGDSAVFLGWSPDSRDFAWRATRYSRVKGRRTVSFMKRTTKGRIAERRPYKYSVPLRTQKKSYVVNEVQGSRQGPFEQLFPLGKDGLLTVRLDVRKRKLGYTIFLKPLGASGDGKRMIGGVFDELWTEFDARVYRSPDGNWVAVMLSMSTPYRSDVWVEGIRVSAFP